MSNQDYLLVRAEDRGASERGTSEPDSTSAQEGAAPQGFRSLAEGGVRAVQRQLSSVGLAQTGRFISQTWGRRFQQRATCPICCDDVLQQDMVSFARCGHEGQGCCRPCMAQYLGGLVADGRINDLRCPILHECDAKPLDSEVQGLSGNETYQRYKRFQQLRDDLTLRECPACAELCKPVDDVEGAPQASMSCAHCGTEFCYYHSNAHVGKTCEEYELQVASEEASARALLGTRPCPGCGIVTEKISGCNHITCSQCRHEWCWQCGESIESLSAHFGTENPRGCRQFETDLGDLDVVSAAKAVVCLGCVLFGACYLLRIWLGVLFFWLLGLVCAVGCCCGAAAASRVLLYGLLLLIFGSCRGESSA